MCAFIRRVATNTEGGSLFAGYYHVIHDALAFSCLQLLVLFYVFWRIGYTAPLINSCTTTTVVCVLFTISEYFQSESYYV